MSIKFTVEAGDAVELAQALDLALAACSPKEDNTPARIDNLKATIGDMMKSIDHQSDIASGLIKRVEDLERSRTNHNESISDHLVRLKSIGDLEANTQERLQVLEKTSKVRIA